MFKIGEFSKLTQVSIRMLRYYDETGLLKPAEIDPFTSYRQYSAEQISQLNRIVFLRDLGFNISEIAVALNQWEDQFIAGLLENKRQSIETAIKAEQDKLAKIELAQKDIRQQQIALHYNVSLKAIPGCQVLSLRRTVPDYYAEGLLWEEMAAFAEKMNISISNQTFTIYHDPDYREKDVDIEICAPVAKLRSDSSGFTYRETDPVPLMASFMVYGAFRNIAGAYRAFTGWLQEHNQYRMTGKTRQIVHRGPWNEDIPEQYLTEIQIPLEEMSSQHFPAFEP